MNRQNILASTKAKINWEWPTPMAPETKRPSKINYLCFVKQLQLLTQYNFSCASLARFKCRTGDRGSYTTASCILKDRNVSLTLNGTIDANRYEHHQVSTSFRSYPRPHEHPCALIMAEINDGTSSQCAVRQPIENKCKPQCKPLWTDYENCAERYAILLLHILFILIYFHLCRSLISSFLKLLALRTGRTAWTARHIISTG